MTQTESVRRSLGGEVGVWTGTLESVSVPRAREVAAQIEDLGYSALWFGEAVGREAFTNSALYLSGTKSLVVATGIANIYARDAMSANAASMTLGDAFGERFVLGLGISHRPLVEGRGHSYDSPLTAMREYLEGMDEAPFMASPVEERPPRVIAALGPKMLELSRDLADGAHPYLTTPKHTKRAREILGDDKLLGVEQGVVLTDDLQKGLELAREYLKMYMTLPNYRKSWLREGFTEEDIEGQGSERFVREIVTIGDEETIRRRVREHLSAGADHVCIQPISDGSVEGLTDDLKRLAPALL